MKESVCLLVFVIVSALFAVLMVAAGFICEYRKKSKVKNTVYECGVIPFSDARIKFNIRYFNYAVLFLIFDIETIFLYPLAVNVNMLGVFAAIEGFVFLVILLIGLYYALQKKFLRWI